MELPQDGSFKKSYNKYKCVVKRWEKQFRVKNGRVPSKHDIKEADTKVRDAYAKYYQLRTQVLEEAVEGLLPVSPPAPDLAPASPSVAAASPAPVFSPPPASPHRHPHPDLPTALQIDRLINTPPQEQLRNGKIWGKHLNIKTSSLKRKWTPISPSKTPEITQNLFKNWSFNKRNPRKIASSKSLTNNDSSPNLSQNIDNISPDSNHQPASMKSLFGIMPFETSFTEIKPTESTTVSQYAPINLLQSVNSSASLPVRNIDTKWLDRCDDSTDTLLDDVAIVQTRCESNSNSSYGLKNLDVKLPPQSYFETSECIENSESDNETLNRNRKIVPVIKKQKLDDPPKPPTVDMEILNKSSDSDLPLKSIQNIKRNTKPKMLKKKRVSKKIKKDKEELKNYESEDDHIELNSDRVDMPRFIINSSLLEQKNLVDGLAKAVDLPKTFAKNRSKNIETSKEDKLLKKINDGSINDNFVRINIEKKVFVRGKKSVNVSRIKKRQFKSKQRALRDLGPEFPEGGILKCFKCNQTGHMSRYCTAHRGNDLLPLQDVVEKSVHLTMQEASQKENRTPILENIAIQPVNIPDVDDILGRLNATVLPKSEPLPESFLKLLAMPVNKSDGIKSVEPLYPLTPDGKLIDTSDEVRDALKKFGYENFREGQERAIIRILSGLSTLLTLSTGSGKSLCYQLPAYLYAKYNKCITLVISPLVSLMEDQVINMPSFLRAGCLHTNQSPTQREKIIELIKDGNIDILLISPEAVVSGERSKGFGGLLKQLPPIAFACIDEVHCVSQWSHNFRPSYLMICRVLREKLGVKCILGLTATATISTTTSIVEHIGISDGLEGVIKNMPLPENLILTVSRDKQRDHALLELLQSERFAKCNSIIIYCIRRDECSRVAALIRTSLQSSNKIVMQKDKSNKKRKRFDWFVEAYHAGMSAAKRKKVQEVFMSGELKIVVATVAFGMGINKSDIRGVIHYNMPSSFESYVQEVGRAGRDGLPAQCHVFIDHECKDKFELLRHIHANSIERHVIRKLLQNIFIPCACKKMKTNSSEAVIKCQGHEVAFSVDETVQQLDIPAENICTLLCYLELHKNKYIKVLSNAYISCKIISYGDFPVLLEAAQNCPPLAMAIALEKKKGNSFKNMGIFEFPVIDIAAAIGWESGMVKNHLKKLEWTNENGAFKRSMLRVEFNTLGFRMMAPGDLDSNELDIALDSIYERTQLQEKTALCQLFEISKTLSELSTTTMDECDRKEQESIYIVNSNKLKKYIHEYFLRDSITSDLVKIDDKPLSRERQVVLDTQALIVAYKDCTFTGRAIARIFQGISSPNFPAIVWGRCKYWRLYLNEDFNKLTEIAKQQIMNMR